jgi:uncharacterized protein Yka (UPF0111/DUF47 family)
MENHLKHIYNQLLKHLMTNNKELINVLVLYEILNSLEICNRILTKRVIQPYHTKYIGQF